MSDDANTGANSGRRRRRRGRRGRNKSGGGGNGGGGGGNRGNNQSSRKRRSKTPEHKFGGREPTSSDSSWNGPQELNTFELFCSYHLGLFENNSYRDPSIKQVARLFGKSIEDIRNALTDSGLDDASVKKTGYDVSLARLDLKVAPEGIDKRELAKNLFDEFRLEHPALAVDWSEAEWDDDDDSDYDDDDSEE